MLGIVPEVKLGDLMSGEEDVPDSIVSCRPNSHWQALEGLRYLEDTAKELEPTFVVNTAYQVGWFVLQGWKDLGKQSLALVLGGRSSKVKGVMGPLQVVDVPPQVEGSLAVRQISEAAPLLPCSPASLQRSWFGGSAHLFPVSEGDKGVHD